MLKKSRLDPLGVEVWSETLEYDDIGRIAKRVRGSRDGKTRSFEYAYKSKWSQSKASEIRTEDLRIQKSFDDEGREVKKSVRGRLGSDFQVGRELERYRDGTVSLVRLEWRSEQGSGSEVIQYELDSLGRVDTVRLENNKRIHITRDSFGEVQSVLFPNGNNFEILRNPRSRFQVGQSVTNNTEARSVVWEHGERGHIESRTRVDSRGTESHLISYSERGFVESETLSQEEISHDYDVTGRPVKDLDVENDLLGRFTKIGDLNISYGFFGEIESAKKGSLEFEYLYDSDSKRIAKATDGRLSEIHLNGLHIVEGEAFIRIVIGGQLVALVNDGNFYPVIQDAVGTSVEDVLRPAYGSEDMRKLIERVIGYAGAPADSDTGLVRMGVRDYLPSLASFITPDMYFLENPGRCVSSPLECNLFSYAANNPLVFADPTGKSVFAYRRVEGDSSSPINVEYVPQSYFQPAAAGSTIFLGQVSYDESGNAFLDPSSGRGYLGDSMPAALNELYLKYDGGLIPMTEVFEADYETNGFKAGVQSAWGAVLDLLSLTPIGRTGQKVVLGLSLGNDAVNSDSTGAAFDLGGYAAGKASERLGYGIGSASFIRNSNALRDEVLPLDSVKYHPNNDASARLIYGN